MSHGGHGHHDGAGDAPRGAPHNMSNDRPGYGQAGASWHDGRVTAPLTPHEQPPHRPWHYPPAPGGPGGPAPGPGEPGGTGRGLARELLEAAVLAVGVAVTGLLLGFLWERLAPRVPLVVGENGIFLQRTESEDAVAIDGTFALLGLAFGAATAALVFLVRRHGGLPLVLAMAVGGVLASLLAWQFGVWLGPTEDVVARAREVGENGVFDAPLQLKAKGALLAWSTAAMVVHLTLTGLFGPREPEQPVPPKAAQGWRGWGGPTG